VGERRDVKGQSVLLFFGVSLIVIVATELVMRPGTVSCRIVVLAICATVAQSSRAQVPPAAAIRDIAITNSQRVIRFAPYPAADEYKLFHADTVQGRYSEDAAAILSGYDWKTPISRPGTLGFYRLHVTTLNDHDLLAATVLNRLAYGPTPDELERVRAMGPQAFIREQLAPENIPENLDWGLDPTTEWQYVRGTGTGPFRLLYISLTAPGEGYIDDLRLVAGTGPEVGPNLLRNGDFEQPLSPDDWRVAPNLARSTQHSHAVKI
jgi:hypothetical protein